MDIKLEKQKLEKLNFENNKIFGSWINNLEQLNKNFINSLPYEHIVIDNFLNDEYISNIEKEFPENYDDWFKYNNPLEVKYAYDNIRNLKKNTEFLFYILSSPQVINLFRKITGINNLNYDEYLHGAGIHAHPRDGKLAIHLDYEKHPISGKERRLNLILYLNKEWKEEWLGSTELWNQDVTECVFKSPIKFNSCLIFRTNDISWHGLPEPIQCPEGVFRKSLAYYYISPLESKGSINKIGGQEDGYRKKATYTLRPQDEKSDYLLRLIKINIKFKYKTII
jgi:Rps23 Pro-64 3,4-dihydroxylase Tpa1-like proline 4-hydroxylase